MKLSLNNAIIESVSTRKDKSYKVVLGLPELPPDEAVKLFSCLQTEVIEAKIDTIPEDGGKSPSQRLRSVVFRLWEKEFRTKYPDFDPFYRVYMERKINEVKDLLD